MFKFKPRSTAKQTKSACFECRICMKNRHLNCMECGKPMADVGPRFKAPPKRDVKEWAIMALWHYRSDRGIRVTGGKPKTVREAKERYSEELKYHFDHKITKYGITDHGRYEVRNPFK